MYENAMFVSRVALRCVLNVHSVQLGAAHEINGTIRLKRPTEHPTLLFKSIRQKVDRALFRRRFSMMPNRILASASLLDKLVQSVSAVSTYLTNIFSNVANKAVFY